MGYYNDEWNDSIDFMGIPDEMHPLLTMPEQQLEAMYPRVYHTIYPAIMESCDSLDMMYGSDYIPTRSEIERMTDDIYVRVEGNVDIIYREESRDFQARQLGWGGRSLLRAFIGTLLIRELIFRRRRPFYGYYYYY